ncbi:hypothetical protein SSS_03116 [Sarcoptes scabiei]|uniref:Uncharacterized protein n=1 Tax=Sarcoptes scabiei TaxID=52283 RepID=A0A834VCU6_SARSC|nr:hypothetical protein SSS_03116 [Sarcoptes scabiei]
MNTGRLSLGVVCMMTNEFYYYSMTEDDQPNLIVENENGQRIQYKNLTENEIFQAAKSIDLNKKINSMASDEDTVFILQEDTISILRCMDNEWIEVLHKKIFSIALIIYQMNRGPDSMYFELCNECNEEQDNHKVILFYGDKFYDCPILEKKSCDGPYNVPIEFFHVNKRCFYGPKLLALALITKIVVIVFFIFYLVMLVYWIYSGIRQMVIYLRSRADSRVNHNPTLSSSFYINFRANGRNQQREPRSPESIEMQPVEEESPIPQNNETKETNKSEQMI